MFKDWARCDKQTLSDIDTLSLMTFDIGSQNEV